MDMRRRISTYIIIAITFAFSVYFFISPFLNPSDQGNLMPSPNQSPDSASTLTSDVDGCVSNPTSDCDQEMLQVKKYCSGNNNQNVPVCSDARVQEYIDNRGLDRPTINTGR
jgi:hypothetical protein